MLHILNYERPQTLEEAYQLRQKKGSAVLGGTGWLRLGEHTLRTAIDLSGLGLRYIREEGEAFSIGAYTTLRDLETDERLNAAFNGAFREAVQAIVGVQFRNCAWLSQPTAPVQLRRRSDPCGRPKAFPWGKVPSAARRMRGTVLVMRATRFNRRGAHRAPAGRRGRRPLRQNRKIPPSRRGGCPHPPAPEDSSHS